MLVHDIPSHAARRFPDRSALVFEDSVLTFTELEAASAALDVRLQQVARRGDVVGILGENHPAFVQAYYGIPRAGMVLLLLNQRLHERELVYIGQDAGLKVLLVTRAFLPVARALEQQLPGLETVLMVDGDGSSDNEAMILDLDSVRAQQAKSLDPIGIVDDDLAWLMYTSGTTGLPKGVQLTHRNLTSGILNVALEMGIGGDDTFLFPFPMCHGAGLSIVIHHLCGARVVLLERFSPQRFCAAVERERVSHALLAATMISMIFQYDERRRFDLTSLGAITYGASAIPTALLERAMDEFRCDFMQGYGSTELGQCVTWLGREDHRRAAAGASHLLKSAGKRMSLVSARVVDPEGRDVAVGEVGEVVSRGDQVTIGYWGNDEASRQQRTRDGWWRSGDLAYMDGEGYFYVVGRATEMVVTGGENVYPREIEDIIITMHGVAEVAVFGVPDEHWGEQVVAAVVVEAGATVDADEIIAFSRTRLAAYKIPRQVLFYPELPKNAGGKILKRVMKEELLSNPSMSAHEGCRR